MDNRARANKRRTVVIASTFGAMVFVVVYLIALLASLPLAGLAIGAAVAIAAVMFARSKADEVALELSEAEAADDATHARLFNTTAGLCVAIGVASPKIYVVDDPAINAMALGTDARNASLVVTAGAIEHLDLVELEALLSLQLHRIRVGDVVPETLAVTTIGIASTLSEITEKWPLVSRAFAVFAPASIAALSRLHTKRDEIDADIAAVGYTRFPPALAGALDKMRGRSTLVVGTPATAHLWAGAPIGPATKTPMTVHATLEERVAVLREL